MHIVFCISLSSIRFSRLDRTDLARLSIPFFFFLDLRRRNLPDVVSGGESNSPSRPMGLLELLPLLKSELSNDEEKSEDPAAPAPLLEGISGLLLPIPPNIPSRNELLDIPPIESPQPPSVLLFIASLLFAAPIPSLMRRP